MIPWLPALPWLPPHGWAGVIRSDAESRCLREPELPPLWGLWRSRLGRFWRNLETSDGKSGQAAANCKQQLTGSKVPSLLTGI